MLNDYLPALPPLGENLKEVLESRVDISEAYELPNEVSFCKTCVISNQRPRISFSDSGICNACEYWAKKNTEIDWESRHHELELMLSRFRKGNGDYDCIVPSSGGKDSVYVAHRLREDFGMNPLTVTWAPSMYTEIGFRNLQAQSHAGFDNVLYTPNGIVHRLMTRASLIAIGDPFQPFVYGQVNLPLRVAVQTGISLIMDGENGEAEYGGDPETESSRGFGAADAEKYWFSSQPAEVFSTLGLSESQLQLYKPPSLEQLQSSSIERHFFSYYKDWRPQSHFYYATSNTGFLPNPNGRSQGTFSKYASLDDELDPYHYYFALLKFGLGRATSDAAHEIREGLIERIEGVGLVNKYDSESPNARTRELLLRYAGITSSELDQIEERWRNKKLWSGERLLFKVQ